MEELECVLRVITNYGLSIVLCVILLWNLLKRDKKRDETVDALSDEIKTIREHDREVTLKAVGDSAKAIEASNVVIDKFADAFSHFSSIFERWQKAWE